MKVVIELDVLDYLENLVSILIDDGYFTSEEYSVTYVNKLIYDIERYISIRQRHTAPPSFNRYGRNLVYVIFK